MGKTIKKIKNCPVHNFPESIFQRGQLSGGEGGNFPVGIFQGGTFPGSIFSGAFFRGAFFPGTFSRTPRINY